MASIELGVRGIGYDEVVLSVGDCGGGGDEQEDDDDDDDEEQDADEDPDNDNESVLSVSGVVGERASEAAGDDDDDDDDAPVDPFGWIELSLWPRWVMRLAPNETSSPGVAARHRDTSEAHRV